MPEAIYFLVINGSRIAELSDPRLLDMFWWEYRISAIDEASERVIRNSDVWEKVDFSIVDADNQQPIFAFADQIPKLVRAVL